MPRSIRRPIAVGVLVTLSVSACHDTLVRSGTPTDRRDSAARASFTPQDYYRGIVFAHGPVADAVPAIRDNIRISNWVTGPEQLRAIENVQSRIMAQIKSDRPEFFASFAAAMRSGDPLAIDRALGDAARVTTQALGQLPEIRVLREELRARPGLMQELKERVADRARERQLDEATYQRALEASLASVLNTTTDDALSPNDPSASTVAILFFAITVVAVQSYVAGFNIAAVINFYLYVAAAGPGMESTAYRAGTPDLGYEQMVHSIARTF